MEHFTPSDTYTSLRSDLASVRSDIGRLRLDLSSARHDLASDRAPLLDLMGQLTPVHVASSSNNNNNTAYQPGPKRTMDLERRPMLEPQRKRSKEMQEVEKAIVQLQKTIEEFHKSGNVKARTQYACYTNIIPHSRRCEIVRLL